ncbi:MAG TPA: hypothetical protein VF982_00995 [Anaerolineales bacterium]
MDAFFNFLAAVAWPGLALYFLWKFEPEIRRKFQGLKQATKDGLVFAEQNALSARDPSSPTALASLPKPLPTIQALETELREGLSDYNADKHIDLLLRNLAQSRVERAFEAVYAEIFDSQVKGLLELHNAGGAINRADAEQYFGQVKLKFPDAFGNTSFDQWFSYVQRNRLAQERDGKIILTDMGRDFLEFAQAYKVGAVRPL